MEDECTKGLIAFCIHVIVRSHFRIINRTQYDQSTWHQVQFSLWTIRQSGKENLERLEICQGSSSGPFLVRPHGVWRSSSSIRAHWS